MDAVGQSGAHRSVDDSLAVTADIKQRSPIVAGLLSIVCLGLGQVYNGQLGKAVALHAMAAILYLKIMKRGWVDSLWLNSYFLTMSIIVFIFIGDAVVSARLAPTEAKLYNTFGFYFLFVAGVFLLWGGLYSSTY